MSRTPRLPKVLLVGPTSPPYAGVEAATETLLVGLERTPGIRWRHFCSGKPVPNAARGHLMPANVLWTLRRLAEYCVTNARFRPDIVHLPLAHNRWGFLRDACLVVIARAFGAKVVMHAHNDSYDRFVRCLGPFLSRAVPRVYCLGSAIVVQGESLQAQFSRLGVKRKLVVMTNHLDVSAYSIRRMSRPDHDYTVLLLGRVSIAKGARDLVQAAVLAAARLDRPIRVTLTGETVLDDRSVYHLADRSADVRAQIALLLRGEAGTRVSVMYLGTLDGPAKRRALDDADVLALPSYSEAQPYAVLEGAAAGLPIVSSAVGMLPEMFARGLRGVLIPAGDVESLADALVALADPERRRLDGLANVEFARREFDISLLPNRLQALYADVAGTVVSA